MQLSYVALLQIQRKLQGMPRDYGRFQTYLRTLSHDGETLDFPSLTIMNPMAKDHVTTLLDAFQALDADAIASQALAEASAQLADDPGEFKVGLVVVDDLLGGWTNRYHCEFNIRFGSIRAVGRGKRPKWLKDAWLTAVLWSSEQATAAAVREAIITTALRAAYVQRHGPARTLREMIAQEGRVMAAASCTGPVLDDDDIAYTREVLIPYLDATDMRTCIECLFGDKAGGTLGFTPHGLSHWAGLALALHDHAQPPGDPFQITVPSATTAARGITTMPSRIT